MKFIGNELNITQQTDIPKNIIERKQLIKRALT
jgi:hypothetical protein